MVEEKNPGFTAPACSPRIQRISAIVLHDTASHTAQSALSWFKNPASKVSAHVVIDRDGTIWRVVPDDKVAWHAGKSMLAGQTGVNGFSLGVEMVYDNDADPYPAAQLGAVVEWCVAKCQAYLIPTTRIVGHQHIALPPGRKVDPGPDFPWGTFYEFVRTARREI